MIRPVTPADSPALLAICGSTGLFPPEELTVIRKLFDDYHAGAAAASGHLAFAHDDEGGTPVGVVYVIPKEMTDRTWELLMIMVDATRQGAGVGSRMVSAVETAVRATNGRMLIAETSSTQEFEQTRRFYFKNGYASVATVPDYYADGVGKTTFTKRL